MRTALIVLVAACAVGGFCVGVANVAALLRQPAELDADALLIRAPDGRCWCAHDTRIKADGDALSWRTDGSGLLVRVRGADWIEVARGDGVNDQGLDWRGAAATLGVDLGACLPAAESAP